MIKRKLHPVFEGINPEELEGPIVESSWRKPLLLLIGVLLAVLIVSLSFSDSLQGIIHSKTARNYQLTFPTATILFEGDTLELLQDEFIAHEDREIKACLFGRQEGSDYIISNVEFPEVIRANVIHVVSVPCPVNTLIDLHGHPINKCLASEQDIETYSEMKTENPSLRMMIMCSSDRFAIV